MLEILAQHQDVEAIFRTLIAHCSKNKVAPTPRLGVQHALQALEVVVAQGWVTTKLDKRRAKSSHPPKGRSVI